MRIWLSGAFSTWKTTVMKWIKAKWHKKINEVARWILTERNIRPQDISKKDFNLFEQEIIEKQIWLESEQKDFVVDTTLFDALAYSEDTENHIENLKTVMAHFRKHIYDIVFLCMSEFDVKDDWIRHIDKDFQTKIEIRIMDIIMKTKHIYPEMKVIPLYWTPEERIESSNRNIWIYTRFKT